LPEPGAPLLLMVSGGADSVAMARLLPELFTQFNYAILHVNHGLRGVDADADEAFVRDLAKELGIRFEARHIDLPAIQASQGGNIEDLGRQLRYSLAAELLAELETEGIAAAGTASRGGIVPAAVSAGTAKAAPAATAGRIVTAHTANDAAETFLMRVIKGGGSAAWAGLKPVRGKVIRPLLDVSRAELVSWLEQQGYSWREDASNADSHYLRAFVRHQLLPLMEQRNPRLIEVIGRSLKVLADESDYLEQQAQAWADRPLEAPHPAITRRALRQAYRAAGGDTSALTFEHIERLRLEGGELGFKVDLPGGITAAAASDRAGSDSQHTTPPTDLRFYPHESQKAPTSFHAELELDTPLETPQGTITMTEVDPHLFAVDPVAYARSQTSENRLLVDADILESAMTSNATKSYPLIVSTIQEGDRFTPLGMPGRHKLVSDLLIDRKIDRLERAAQLKISVNDAIIWIIGVQPDDRFAVRPESRRLFSIIVKSS